MGARHILYLTNATLVSLVASGGRFTGRRAFAVSPSGREEFAAYVADLKRLPTHVLTDLAEEDFRLDTIPHLGARDRDAVLSRKLSQIFRSTPYRHAIAQGREPEGRRDDRVLYTAITNGELLRPWLDVLEKLEVPLEGIQSSAVFSSRLAADLGLAFPHTLLVTFTPGGALRQTYFRAGEVKFSRLTPIDLEEEDTLGGLLAGETARTWQYLDSLRSFQQGDHLEVCVIVHPKDRGAVEPALRDFNQIRYRLVDIEQAAAQVGLKPPPLGSGAEELIVHELVRRGPANHFAPAESLRIAQVRRTRLGLFAVSGAVLAVGLAYAGWNVALALQNREQDLRTGQQVRALQREHDEIMRSMPTQGVAGETMRDTVAFYGATLRGYPSVGELLQPVSTVLDRHPRIRVTQVAWQAAPDDNATPVISPVVPRNMPAVKALARSSEGSPPAPAARGPNDPEANVPFAPGKMSIALVEATVRVDGTGFRAALADVESLVAEVNALPGYRARIVESPLDVTPKTGIQGKLVERPAGTADARFTFRVARPSEPRS